jgi:hypothetical protein
MKNLKTKKMKLDSTKKEKFIEQITMNKTKTLKYKQENNDLKRIFFGGKHFTTLHLHSAQPVNAFNRRVTLTVLPLVGIAWSRLLGLGR